MIQKLCCHPMLLYKKFQGAVGQKEKKLIAAGEVEDDVEVDVGDTSWMDSVIPLEGRERVSLDYTTAAKIIALKEIMQETFHRKEKLLVFSRYKSTLDVIMNFIEMDSFGLGKLKLEEDFYRVDGTTPPDKRHDFCERFNKSER